MGSVFLSWKKENPKNFNERRKERKNERKKKEDRPGSKRTVRLHLSMTLISFSETFSTKNRNSGQSSGAPPVMSTVWMDGEFSRTCRILKKLFVAAIWTFEFYGYSVKSMGKYFLNDLFIVSHVSNSNFEFKVFPAK